MTETVVVESVLSAGRFGGAIFSASRANGSRVRIVASRRVMPQAPITGEIWSITGRLQSHPQYGAQVVADAAERERPSGRLVTQHLEKCPAFPGIGRARAAALWDAFGLRLYELLDSGAVARLATVVGDDLARVLVEGWATERALGPAIRWLEQHGFPVWLARKIIAIWGAEGESKLTENPYRMLAFASWNATDRAGLALGIARDDERRLVAAAEACCYQRLTLGHTRVGDKELVGRVRRLLGCSSDQAEAAIRAADVDRAIVRAGAGWQPYGPAAMERFVAAQVAAMVSGRSAPAQPALVGELTNAGFEAALRAFERREGYRLNREQREAVLMALTSPLSVLCGGAGVGKTTTLKAIHEALEQRGGRIHQMALSGRAALRMREATGRPAKTIAGFLLGVRDGSIDLGLDPLLIVDEASMIDLPTMYRIIRRLQPGCRLLLVGDPGQLPPIGFGIVFHTLAAHEGVPRVELIEVHRQAAATGIPNAAAALRRGEVPILNRFAGRRPGVSFIEAAPDAVVGHLVDIVGALGGFDEVQIVGATKRGPAGTETINVAFHDLLSPGRPTFLGYSLCEPVIWLVNDWDLGILNGSLGVVRKGDDDGLEIDFDGEIKFVSEARLDDLGHAYAITTHKAQGSQFRRVLVPIVRSRLLDRTLLYTAMTRAQEQVVFIGDRAAFEAAILEPPHVFRREVGLEDHLSASDLVAA